MEDLTKTQLLLLAIMVSFITSIATGIATVTLLDQAPPEIYQPIQKVVKQTIENILPSEIREITNTNTIVVKEEELIAEAINENKNSVIAVERQIQGEADLTPASEGVGFIVSADGKIITAGGKSGDAVYTTAIGGIAYNLKLISNNPAGFSIMQVVSEDQLSLSYSTFTNSNTVEIGYGVVALAQSPFKIMKGYVSGFREEIIELPAEEGDEPETLVYRIISTTIDLPLEYSGSPIINSDGNVIGIAIKGAGEVSIIPSNKIIQALNEVPQPEEVTRQQKEAPGEVDIS